MSVTVHPLYSGLMARRSANARALAAPGPDDMTLQAIVKAGAQALAPDGRPFNQDTIGMALALRNLMHDLRSAGAPTRGPRPFSPRDRSAFLSALEDVVRRQQRARARG